MKKNQIVIITAALALQVSSALAQGPLNIFK